MLDVLIRYIEKRKTNPFIRDLRVLYPEVASHLLWCIFNRHGTAEKVIIFIDTLPARKKQAMEKSLKKNIKQLVGSKEFHIYHHSSMSNFGLQAIDYCMWAVFRK